MFRDLSPGAVGIKASFVEGMELAKGAGYEGVDLNVGEAARLAQEHSIEWVRDQVAYVLNYRYNENKVTIVTTNFLDYDTDETKAGRADSLTQRIGPRIRSRLFEMCKTIKMDGKDFRAEIMHANHHTRRH